MSTAMSQREKVLAACVGGVVLVLVNFFLIGYFLRTNSELHAQLAVKRSQMSALRELVVDTPKWNRNDAWLKAHQPRIENEGTAGVQMLDLTVNVAKKHSMLIQQQAIGGIERRPDFISAPVNLEVKGSWKDLLGFLYELQAPERFIVLEALNLQIDAQDQTKMVAKLRVSRWFQPK